MDYDRINKKVWARVKKVSFEEGNSIITLQQLRITGRGTLHPYATRYRRSGDSWLIDFTPECFVTSDDFIRYLDRVEIDYEQFA